jgi:hypothetical protein
VSPEAPTSREPSGFVGSQQASERAALVMSLIESAKLNGHDPWVYLKDVFERMPTLKQRASRSCCRTTGAPPVRSSGQTQPPPPLSFAFNTPCSEAQGCGFRNVHGRPRFAKLSIHDGSKVKIAPVHSDFECSFWAAVPDGICWLTPQSLTRTLGASFRAGLVNHGLTCLAITSCSPEQSVVFLPDVVCSRLHSVLAHMAASAFVSPFT